MAFTVNRSDMMWSTLPSLDDGDILLGLYPNITDLPKDNVYVNFLRFSMEGILLPLVGLLGIVGNVLSLVVLCRADIDLNPIFRNLLYTLSFCDTLCIIGSILIFSLPNLSDIYRGQVFPRVVPHLLPLAQIALTGSVYATVGVAVERYMSVCYPHTTIPSNTSVYSIIFIIVFSISFNITRFFEFNTTEEVARCREMMTNCSLGPNEPAFVFGVTPTPLRMNATYSKISMLSSVLCLNVLPLVCLIFLNTAIYVAIRKRTNRLALMTSRQRRDMTVAMVLVFIVIIFVFCHSFKCVLNVCELVATFNGKELRHAWGPHLDLIASLSHFLITLNSSINFLIYVAKDNKFRVVFMKSLCLCQKATVKAPGRSRSSSSNNAAVTKHVDRDKDSDNLVTYNGNSSMVVISVDFTNSVRYQSSTVSRNSKTEVIKMTTDDNLSYKGPEKHDL